jgi:hypothetical protein
MIRGKACPLDKFRLSHEIEREIRIQLPITLDLDPVRFPYPELTGLEPV